MAVKTTKIITRVHYRPHDRDYEAGVVLALSKAERDRLVGLGVAEETNEAATVFEAEKPQEVFAPSGQPRRFGPEKKQKSGGKE